MLLLMDSDPISNRDKVQNFVSPHILAFDSHTRDFEQRFHGYVLEQKGYVQCGSDMGTRWCNQNRISRRYCEFSRHGR
ncbi:hypothetical protein C8R21_11276 [Nitrosospira multiformis]|uniref:Uncharacterized protein n=1 Tax=Nitrosospira multiformis TaxID=1231 RepID=A0A2T5IB64_9PROT|nr:hypothetical protein C8R21_11276 [Nitrosospira multiformis]